MSSLKRRQEKARRESHAHRIAKRMKRKKRGLESWKRRLAEAAVRALTPRDGFAQMRAVVRRARILRGLLAKLPSKVQAQAERAAGCVCTALEEDDFVRDWRGAVVGRVTVQREVPS